MPARKYSDEQIQFIADNIQGRRHKEMAALFNEHFGTDIPESKIRSLSFKHGLKNGIDCRLNTGYVPAQFPKGHEPWNKGKKGVTCGGEATRFVKGQKGWNYMPVGSERINSDGYVDVKVADPGKWLQKHHLMWEAANGPIPKGHCLIFADSNPLNVVMENLILITRAELAVMNKRGLIAKSRELTEAGILVSDIIMKVTDIKKKGRKSP